MAEAQRTDRPTRSWRGRRHLAPAAVVLAYLLAGGVTAALGSHVAGAGWLALHLVLLGAASNAIIVWSEHFAAALLHGRASSEPLALARLLTLTLAVLAGVHGGRPALASVGGSVLAMLVLAHAVGLAGSIRRCCAPAWSPASAAPPRRRCCSWWVGLGSPPRGCSAGTAALPWSAWPATRPGSPPRWVLCAHHAAAPCGRLGRLIPAVAVGFGLQTLAGALTYLLPAVWGRGAHGNRRLTRLLEAGWPLRVAALNLGVAAVTVGSAGTPMTLAGQLLIGSGLGSFVVLAAIALAWRPEAGPGTAAAAHKLRGQPRPAWRPRIHRTGGSRAGESGPKTGRADAPTAELASGRR